MTKSEVRALLLKTANGEHGAYVLHLFEDIFGEEKMDTKLETEDMDRFLKLAIELASIKTRLNGSRNNSKQKHYKVFILNTQKQS